MWFWCLFSVSHAFLLSFSSQVNPSDFLVMQHSSPHSFLLYPIFLASEDMANLIALAFGRMIPNCNVADQFRNSVFADDLLHPIPKRTTFRSACLHMSNTLTRSNWKNLPFAHLPVLAAKEALGTASENPVFPCSRYTSASGRRARRSPADARSAARQSAAPARSCRRCREARSRHTSHG